MGWIDHYHKWSLVKLFVLADLYVRLKSVNRLFHYLLEPEH